MRKPIVGEKGPIVLHLVVKELNGQNIDNCTKHRNMGYERANVLSMTPMHKIIHDSEKA